MFNGLNVLLVGVVLDSHLNYNLHVNKVRPKIVGRIGQLYLILKLECLAPQIGILIYESFLRSLITYATPILKNRKTLQAQQNK